MITDEQLAEIQHDLDTRQQMNLTEAAQIFAGHTRSLLAEISAYERNIEDLNDKALKAIRDIARERDLAIAHDRQPYPTAWAYEQACKTIERMRPVVERAQEWRDGFARPAAGPFPRQLALCDAVDAYESEMEAIAAANQSGGDVPVEPAEAVDHG